MNVAELILAQGKDSAPALLCGQTVTTYATLRREVGEIRRLLANCQPGERVGIWSENNPFFVAAYLGIIRAGMVAVPFQTEVSEGTFQKIAAEAGIRQVFVSKRFLLKLKPWAQRAGVHLVSPGEQAAAPGGQDGAGQLAALKTSEPILNEGEALAALMFTSGSTGAPKGVMITHRNIECNSRDIIEYMGLASDDRVMVVLPFHYCFGLSLLHTHLLAGGSLVLNNDFRLYPESVLKEMQEKECTGLAGVPSTYQILLRKSRFRRMAFPRLRWFQQAGGKLPNPCINEIRESFPQVKYYLMYGQTEGTARLSYLPPERLADKLGSIGRGLPSTKLEVLRPDGTPVQPGEAGGAPGAESVDWEIGEIVASGGNIARGYWNDAAETAKFFRNGRLHTGDLARVDKDGFIFIMERERDMIKSGGNRVSAKEIEEVVAELSDVVEVAVVGVPDEILGEAIIAFVVLHPQATADPETIRTHCRKRLPAFKAPEAVVVLKALPHNGAGKVMKQELRKWQAVQQFEAVSG